MAEALAAAALGAAAFQAVVVWVLACLQGDYEAKVQPWVRRCPLGTQSMLGGGMALAEGGLHSALAPRWIPPMAKAKCAAALGTEVAVAASRCLGMR